MVAPLGRRSGEGKFTVGEFSAVNMKNCGHHNIRKHRDIKFSEKYVTLDISLKFGSLEKIRITYSDSKDNLGRSGKGLITSLGIKAKARPSMYKKSRYAIGNVSKKDLSKIIRNFDRLHYNSYDRSRPKHKPTNSYLYLSRHLENFMMRADSLNSHVYLLRTEMTATKQVPISYVFSTDEIELEEFLVEKTISQICYTEEDK